jgi:hypothetical protein
MAPEHWADLSELRQRLRTPSNAETFRAAVREYLRRLRREDSEREQAEASKRVLLARLQTSTDS